MTGSELKAWARVSGTTVLIVTLLGGVAVWNAAFRTPPVNPLPIPDTLIAADSPAGKQLLTENFLSDYESLTRAFETQSKPGFCGVASSVVVLNALTGGTGHLTQATFFTERASKVRTSLQVTFRGMTLEHLGALLQTHGATTTVHYASDTSVDAFRAIAQQNLATPGDFMLVNYERAALGQDKTGHISPIAAYNAKTDRLLILDVATYKYPWVWVSTEALWTAMNTVDSASGRSRGFAVVRRTPRRRRDNPERQLSGKLRARCMRRYSARSDRSNCEQDCFTSRMGVAYSTATQGRHVFGSRSGRLMMHVT